MAATSPESVKTFDPFYPKSVESIEPSDLASERVEHSKKSEGTEVLVSDLDHPPAAEQPKVVAAASAKEFHNAGSWGFKYSSNEDPRILELPDEYFYGSHDITDEELAFHRKQVKESDGFDIINIPNCFAFGMLQMLPCTESVFCRYTPQTVVAINHYNQENNTKFELRRILKVNLQATRHDEIYITFQASDKNVVDAASAIKTFQAKVIDDTSGYISGSGKREMIVKICRLKPTEEQGD